MNRPETIDDVWPHEETILAVTETGTCFGRSIDKVMSEIVENSHVLEGGRHSNNGLSAYHECLEINDLDNSLELAPNSLLVVEDSCIEKGFKSFLDGTSLPAATWIAIYVDSGIQEERKEELKEKIPRSIDVATNQTDLLTIGDHYFRTICPTCSGDAARSYILRWSQAVYQRVHN